MVTRSPQGGKRRLSRDERDRIEDLIDEIGEGSHRDRVVRTRAILGESVTQFGARIGCSHAYVVMIERGKRESIGDAIMIGVAKAEGAATARLRGILDRR